MTRPYPLSHREEGTGVDRWVSLHAPPRCPLDIVARRWVITEPNDTRKAVQAVADSNVECLAKNAVPLRRVRNDLGVAAGHIQDDGIHSTRDGASHLNVADAVVHTDKRLVVEDSKGSCHKRDSLQRCAHAWTLGIADAVDLCQAREPCRTDSLGYHTYDPVLVVLGRIAWLESLTGRSDIRVPHVG